MYSTMTQDELISRLQSLTEFIAQQQQNTQLVIVIIVLLLVGGAIAIMTLRGGIRVFDRLGNAIEKLANIESDRHETTKELVSVVKRFSVQNERRYEKVDEIWSEVMNKVNDLDDKFESLYQVIENNPTEHQMVIELLTQINTKLENTKHKTDEMEKVNHHE